MTTSSVRASETCLRYKQGFARGFTPALTVDEDEKLLFFSDIQRRSISRVSLENNATVDEIIGGRGAVEGKYNFDIYIILV